jgi:hypothetical protein
LGRTYTYTSNSTRRKRISEGLAVIAAAFFLILIADTSSGRGGMDFWE